MQGSSLVYPVFAFTLIMVSLILIPRERYRILLPVVLVSVLIHAVLLYVTINVVEAFRYTHDEPFSILGIPVFISISWGPSFALFLWGLPEKRPGWARYVYMGIFALIGVFIDMTFQSLGLRPISEGYSAWMWFSPLFGVYWITYILYKKSKELETL